LRVIDCFLDSADFASHAEAVVSGDGDASRTTLAVARLSPSAYGDMTVLSILGEETRPWDASDVACRRGYGCVCGCGYVFGCGYLGAPYILVMGAS